MILQLLVFSTSLAFSILCWLKGRPKGWIFPSDTFFLACLLMTGTVPFFNLHAVAPETVGFTFSDEVVGRVLTALSIVYVCLGLVWMLRPPIVAQHLLPSSFRTASGEAASWRNSMPILLLGAGAFIAIATTALIYPPYLAFKMEVIRFLTGNISASEYQLARRVTFSDDTAINGIIGRLRFSLFPILFLCAVMVTARLSGWVVSGIFAVILFIIGPASMSKAPIVIYAAYFVLSMSYMKRFELIFKAKFFIMLSGIGAVMLVFSLSIIYMLQYRDYFRDLSSLPEAIALAYYRVFVATYQGLLQHFTVYPSTGGYVGLSGMSLTAALTGTDTRDVDEEVSIYFLGDSASLSSFPTMFAGGAYDLFGYTGVAVFSLGIGIYVAFLDRIFTTIQSAQLRAIYAATIMVNVLFFTVLAAPAVMLSYGCGLIPFLVMAVDRVVARVNIRGSGTQTLHVNR